MARDVEVVKEHRDAIVDKRTSYARRMPLQSEVHHHNKHNVFSMYRFIQYSLRN